MVAALLCALAVVTTQETQPAVRAELNAYYETEKRPASWDAWLKQLTSARADDRRTAVTRLVELMDQSLQDEKSAKAPWRASPFWGEGAQNAARKLRESIAETMEKAPPAPELLTMVQWILRNETQVNLHENAANALAKINGKDVDEYRRALLLEPHPNAVVMGKVLAQCEARKLPIPADRLRDLCHHHRLEIRENARKLNRALNGPDPGPFDPAQAFKSPAVRRILDQLQALMIDLPDKNAEFVEITIKYMDKDQLKDTARVHGWLLEKDANSFTIYSPYGHREIYENNEKTKISQSEKTEGGWRSWKIDVTTSVTMTPYPIADYVKQLSEIRAKGNNEYQLSSRGGLTGQFQGSGASLKEAILAAWLDRASKADLAAAILLPALDTLYEDRGIVDMTRVQLGDILGYRMLVAFVGDRDYLKALTLARTLADHYPDTRFFKYAKELSAELPLRMDDFKTFKLPTPREWEEMKKTMSRREQIDFLCDHLRLLNCFQWGQPGGYSSSDKQYAEPSGLSQNAAWGLNKGKTEVINPIVELVGNDGVFLFEPEKRGAGLKLTVADIPSLAPHLKENWYELIVSFWRDFHPDRYMGKTRGEITSWINGLAHRNLCEMNRFDEMSPDEKEAHIRKISAWAEANKNRTEEELLVERVQADIDRKQEWRNVLGNIESLMKMKNPKALGFVEHYLELQQNERWGYELDQMLKDVQQLDPQKAVEWAKKFLEHKDNYLRMHAAMLVFEAGDKERTIPILAELLATGSGTDIGPYAANAVDALLNRNTPQATDAALRILRNKGLYEPKVGFEGDLQDDGAFYNYRDDVDRAAIITRLAKAGHPEGFQIYLDLLDVKGNTYGEGWFGAPVARLAVWEIVRMLGKNDAALQKVRKMKDVEEQRLAVRHWVEEKRNARGAK